MLELSFFFYRIGTGQAYQLIILGRIDSDARNYGPVSDYFSFLTFPILVTGAYLLTNGECSLASPFRLNINSEDDTGSYMYYIIKYCSLNLYCSPN